MRGDRKRYMSKQKLSVDGQIEHMKGKGIRFAEISEEDAKQFLENSTYYFKIKSYSKNYDKYEHTEKVGQYIDLDFAYLKELSTIDMHLRHFIIKTCLDIEHAIKVRLLRDFNNSSEDGYSIVQKLFDENPGLESSILQKKANSVCNDLIDKLIKDKYAIWNIVEVLSLGDFIKLYELFYREYPEAAQGEIFTYPLRSIKSIRNAAAHSNCLLNTLKKPYSGSVAQNRKISSYVSKIDGISSRVRTNKMSNQVIHDFVTMLYVFDKIVESDGVRKHTLAELHQLVNVRMTRNRHYFTKNESIKSTYDFIKKIVDYLYANRIY